MSTNRQLAISALLGTLAYLAILIALRFHLCLNDFWAWSFFAERMLFTDPSTLYNGFIPPGYAVLLRLVDPAHDIHLAFVVTLISCAVTLFSCAKIAERIGGLLVAHVTILLALLFPPFLQSGLTAGPDILVAALVSAAAAMLFAEDLARRNAILAGVLFGCAMLVRTHAAFAAAGILVAIAVIDRARIRAMLPVLIGLGSAVLTQAMIAIAASQSPWANAQAFNVYKMVHGVNWYDPHIPDNLSLLGLIAEDPAKFAYEWAGALKRAGIWLAAPLVSAALAWRLGQTKLLRASLVAFLGGAIYTAPVSLGDSPRTAVVIVALIVPVLVAVLFESVSRKQITASVISGLVLLLGFGSALKEDRAFLTHNFDQSRDFAAVEATLIEAGAASGLQVFSDDFDLYFRSFPARRPLTRGGWGIFGIDGWTETYPQMPLDSPASFLDGCRANGVEYLALTKSSGFLAPGFAVLRKDPESVGLMLLEECGAFRVYRLSEISPSNSTPNSAPQER